MKKIFIITITIVLASAVRIQAQNDFQFSQFMFNELCYNPAVAATSNDINLSLLGRQQWVGFGGAPSTQSFNAYCNLEKIGGLGLNVLNDQLGYEHNLNARFSYARNFKLGDTTSFCLGISGGIASRSVDADELTFENPAEVIAPSDLENKTNGDFGVGLVFRTHGFTLMASSSHITQSLEKSDFYKVPRHYYLNMSYRFDLGNYWTLTPSFFARSSEFITQYDLHVRASYDNKFWFGVTYRWDESAILLAGVRITDYLGIGYAGDWITGPAASYSQTSHELMLISKIRGPKKKSPAPMMF
ncbi:hypothetical protein SDC9_78232 [bioreactor metagenome]|uniref:Type IX secretion system membrane protein PorP/SprF n=1 Tax=bioreactor metagenome TaxID=1076179 RepID=A0A644YSX2_9ZZZZ